MTFRAIDNTNGVWATGTPNYPAGAHPWSATTTVSSPVYNFFTPNVPPAAQEFNSLFNSLTFAYDALVKWVAPSATLTAPSDLTAMTDTVVAGETRFIPGWGMYIYGTTSVIVNDGIMAVAGHAGGATQWRRVNYTNTGYRELVQFGTDTYAGTAKTLTGSFDTTDPVGRNAGNVGREVCQIGASFAALKGDVFEISYSVPLTLVAAAQSDVVTGVRYSAGNYIADSIDNSGQVTAGTSPWGSSTHGVLYTGLASGNDMRILITRTFFWQNLTVSGNVTFQLDAACDTQAHGSILQGAQLQVKQWRGVTTF